MKERLQFFDGLRAVAICLVVLAHLTEIASFKRAFTPIFDFGSLARVGVHIFFFISGFVIYRFVLAARLHDSVRAFYLRRFARLLPSMAVYLLVCFILGALRWIDFGFYNFLTPFSYLTNTTLVHPTWYAGHTWSLSFEEQFYLLSPFVLRWAHLGVLGRLFVLLGAVIFIALPVIFTVPWIGRSGVFSVWFLLFFGVVSAKLRLEEWSCPFPIPVFTCLLLLLFALRFVSVQESFVRIAEVFILPPLLLCAYQLKQVRRLLSSSPFQFVGGVSYSLYLWQQLFTGPWLLSIELVYVPILVLAMLLFAIVSNKLLEVRLKAYLYSKIV